MGPYEREAASSERPRDNSSSDKAEEVQLSWVPSSCRGRQRHGAGVFLQPPEGPALPTPWLWPSETHFGLLTSSITREEICASLNH